jgi:hypothetical protein
VADTRKVNMADIWRNNANSIDVRYMLIVSLKPFWIEV